MATVIDLIPTGDYRRNTYGVILQSKTVHQITGRGVHNRHFDHRLDVWMNANGIDPKGKPTTEDLSFLWSAQPSVISTQRLAGPEQGEVLALEEVVVLRIGERELGRYRITHQMHHDPHMVKVV